MSVETENPLRELLKKMNSGITQTGNILFPFLNEIHLLHLRPLHTERVEIFMLMLCNYYSASLDVFPTLPSRIQTA